MNMDKINMRRTKKRTARAARGRRSPSVVEIMENDRPRSRSPRCEPSRRTILENVARAMDKRIEESGINPYRIMSKVRHDNHAISFVF